MSERRGLGLAVLIAVVVLAGVASGCGGDDDDGGGGSAGGGGGGGDAPKVAVLSVGTKDDTRWGQSWFQGAQDATEAGDAEASFTGNLNSPDQYVSQASAFASRGYKIVILANGGVAEAAVELANQFPNTIFCQGTYQPSEEERSKEPPNVCHMDVEQQEPSFLAGAVAGLATKTNVVGAINAFKFPALTRQPEAFALGARCVNPDVKFVQKYINSFTDVAFAKAAAQTLMREGADVIYSVTDDATEGVYAAARTRKGTYVIPQYFDSYDAAPDVVLTTAEFDIPKAEAALLKKAAAGLPDNYFESFDISQGYGGIAPFHDNESALGPDGVAKYKEIEEKVKSGEITVPDEMEGSAPLGEQGSGSKIDPAEIGC
jgi:basic membrane protein A